jgi:hypothetical protein
MTINLTQINSSTDTFGQWVYKTNLMINAISNSVVTTNSNTTTGNAAITGAFYANAYYTKTLSGGSWSSTGTPAPTAANLSIVSNVAFTGAITKLGLAANVVINGGSAGNRVVTVNADAGNTLFVGQLRADTDLEDISIVLPTDGDILVYNDSTSQWINSKIESIVDITLANNVTIQNSVVIGTTSTNTVMNATQLRIANSSYSVVVNASSFVAGNTAQNTVVNSTSVFTGNVYVNDLSGNVSNLQSGLLTLSKTTNPQYTANLSSTTINIANVNSNLISANIVSAVTVNASNNINLAGQDLLQYVFLYSLNL